MRKQHILYIVVILLSIINAINFNNASALSYSSEVGVGFTFNPTLSVSLSSSDLVISNLAPGSSADSNNINVSVATNASYGYTLSATVGDSTYNNSNLTHSNNTNIFSSIAIDADLSSLNEDEDTNIWGYSYRNNIASPSTWSNYNGLSSSSNAILLDNDDMADSTGSIDFKIGAKAASTQASGTYTNTINFIAVTKVAPMSLLDSFIASGAEQLNGYYKMQDMTHDICESVDIEESELQLIDVRDNKVYWVAKLKDGNCWMTQNLDLNIDETKIYTHNDTDLGWTILDENATWQPAQGHSTINFTGSTTVDGWVDSSTEPYSANPGDIYFYTSNSGVDNVKYNSLQECSRAGHNDCAHYSTGNYYNWIAAVASNSINVNLPDRTQMPNSICPSRWRLPTLFSSNEFGKLLYAQNIILDETSSGNSAFTSSGATLILQKPIYISKVGQVNNNLQDQGSLVKYWGNQSWGASRAYSLYFRNDTIAPRDSNDRSGGNIIRCIAR